jgi:hypothetical protein
LRTIAIGMLELKGGHDTQALATDGNGIDVACGIRVTVSIERDGSNATMTSSTLVGVPCIISSISGDMCGVLIERDDRSLIEWSEIGHIVFVERLGIFGQDYVAIVGHGGAGIKLEMEAELDDEQGMLEQEAAQLAGVEQAFALTDQECFEVGALWMGRASTRRTLRLPALNQGPIKQREEGAILLNKGIVGQQSSHHGLVKQIRRGYHTQKLLLWGELFSDTLQKEFFLCQGEKDGFPENEIIVRAMNYLLQL